MVSDFEAWFREQKQKLIIYDEALNKKQRLEEMFADTLDKEENPLRYVFTGKMMEKMNLLRLVLLMGL